MSQLEEEGRTIFLPKGHFFSLWLTHKDHLKGSLKYHSSIHSARERALSTESKRGVSLQAGEGLRVSLDLIFTPQYVRRKADQSP